MASRCTFASPWALTPVGRDVLLSKFRSTPAGINAQIVTEDLGDECVSLQCTEQAFVSFIEFASKFYNEELASHRDVFESPELHRLDGTSPVAAFPLATAPPVQIETQRTHLIEHEIHCESWTPSQKDDHGNILFNVLPATIGRIESLTSVRIEISHCFTIIGDNEEVVSKTIQKLNILEESMAHQRNTQNYLVIEGSISIELQLIPLKIVPDARLKTTLLLPRSPCYKSLRNCHIVVMLKDGVICPVKPTVRGGESTHLWHQHELSHLFPRTSIQGTAATSPIAKWIDESNAAPLIDPFLPADDFEVAGKICSNIVPPKHSPEKVSTKRLRKVKGATEALPAGSQSNIVSTYPELPEAEIMRQEWLRLEPRNRTSTANEFVHSPSLGVLSETAQPPCQTILPQSQIPEEIARTLPAINPPIMPPPPQMAVPRVGQPSPRAWENRHVTSAESNRSPLIGVEPPSVNTETKKAKKDQKHYTMNQGKPQMIAGESAHIRQYQKYVLETLSKVTARPGVQLSVDIGRILIDRRTIPDELCNMPFDVKEWPNAVNRLRTEFTSILTTKASDISNILNTKLLQGRNLFIQAPIQRKVVYMIDCQTRSNERIVIEVDDDQNFTIGGLRVMDGALNWHFVRRAWDARLRVSSQDFIGGDYIQEIRSIVDSVRKTPSLNGDGLTFSFHTKGSVSYIHSVLVRRETMHTSTIYPDLLVHFAEVQDLKVSQDAGNVDQYTGTIKSEDEMVAKHRVWWEASISSQHATDILKESSALELGERAKWKPEQVIGNNVVSDLYTLAWEIVTRIDYVGIDNKGPAGSGSKSSAKPSEKGPELPTGPYGFW